MKDESRVCLRCGIQYFEDLDCCPADGAPLHGARAVARLGLRMKDYEIQEILGEGGMGVVYKGLHVVLEKPVAIKVLDEGLARRKDAVDQFLLEAKAASRIRHPNIIDITDFGTTPDGLVFFVMEYLEGEDLFTRLARVHTFSVFDAVNVVYQVARALGAAHQQGIVHRDLKPGNVLLIRREGRRSVVLQREDGAFTVEKEGEFDFVKLLDFGIAKFLDLPSLDAGLIVGTPQYLSPEQASSGPIDCRSDIYALGVLFYEMVTGVAPFDGSSLVEIIRSHLSDAVIPPKQRNPRVRVDDATNQTILRCLEKDPEKRFQTMDDLCDALQDCYTDRVFLRNAYRMPGAQAAGFGQQPIPERGPRQVNGLEGLAAPADPDLLDPDLLEPDLLPHRRWTTAAAVALVLVAAAVTWFFYRSRTPAAIASRSHATLAATPRTPPASVRAVRAGPTPRVDAGRAPPQREARALRGAAPASAHPARARKRADLIPAPPAPTAPAPVPEKRPANKELTIDPFAQ